MADIALRIATLSTGRVAVGIDGRTASGKTSFGHDLAVGVARTGRTVLRACLDDYKKPWADRHLYDRETGGGYYRNAFDYDAVRRLLLEPIHTAGPASVALCSIDPLTQQDHSAILTPVSDDAVLIVDGVFAFRPELNNYWNLRIWLDIDRATAIKRGSTRDRNWSGSDTETLHINRYAAAEDFYMTEANPTTIADIIIDNHNFASPHIKPKS